MGYGFIIAGVLLLLGSLMMDTTAGNYSAVLNIGALQHQLMVFHAGLVSTALGIYIVKRDADRKYDRDRLFNMLQQLYTRLGETHSKNLPISDAEIAAVEPEPSGDFDPSQYDEFSDDGSFNDPSSSFDRYIWVILAVIVAILGFAILMNSDRSASNEQSNSELMEQIEADAQSLSDNAAEVGDAPPGAEAQ